MRAVRPKKLERALPEDLLRLPSFEAADGDQGCQWLPSMAVRSVYWCSTSTSVPTLHGDTICIQLQYHTSSLSSQSDIVDTQSSTTSAAHSIFSVEAPGMPRLGGTALSSLSDDPCSTFKMAMRSISRARTRRCNDLILSSSIMSTALMGVVIRNTAR